MRFVRNNPIFWGVLGQPDIGVLRSTARLGLKGARYTLVTYTAYRRSTLATIATASSLKTLGKRLEVLAKGQ